MEHSTCYHPWLIIFGCRNTCQTYVSLPLDMFFCGIHSVKLGLLGHTWLPVVWSQPPSRIKQTCLALAALMCGHIFSEKNSLPVALAVPDDPQITPAIRWCISFPMSLGWLTNTGYSHMLLLLFLIHYTAHMSRFASSCSLNKQKRHSTAVAKSLWTKLLPLTHHSFNYVLENIKQVGQFVVGNHISIERA